jgi:CRISPR system Cascade subunit CasC
MIQLEKLHTHTYQIKETKMFIELHLIQNFSPANLNRDDTNNPKDCTFGGHRRARISSQALKRAIRHEPVFAQTTLVDNGERSKWMTRPIKDKLIAAGKESEQARDVAVAFVNAYAAKSDKNNPERSSVLIYFSQEEIQAAIDGILADWDAVVATTKNNKTLDKLVGTLSKETKNRTSAPDIALFGRMLAEKPELNIDAACQVAHAISTHRVNMEMDYYTAIDDLQETSDEEGAGAGMIGFTNFNSSCFYRYVRLDWEQLLNNLGDNVILAGRTIEGFLRSTLDAIPTGKQNAFAAQNPTSMALALVREDGKSWNLANAFEEPIHAASNSGLIRPSMIALDTYWGDLVSRRDDAVFNAISVYTDSSKHLDSLENLAVYCQPNIAAWINVINEVLPKV